MSDTAEATHTSQPGFASGGRTAAGFMRRIIDHCAEVGEFISESKARRLGVRLARRAERMQEEFDFYEGLRVLGIQSDPTAREAVYNIEKTTRREPK